MPSNSPSKSARPSIKVKARQALPLWSRDPWLYSGAIASVDGFPASGELVDVRADDGRWIGVGHYAPSSRIAVRMVCWDQGTEIDEKFWRSRFDQAIKKRTEALGLGGETNAYRVLHAEGDGVPGMVIDRLGDFFALQCGTAAAMDLRPAAVAALSQSWPDCKILERHDGDALEREGVTKLSGLEGAVEAPDRLTVLEGGVPIVLSPSRGQKTGFYTDQRENRMRIGAMARGRTVADLFCYTGGFSLHAAAGGATAVVAVDSSAPALELAAEGAAAGKHEKVEFVAADAVNWASEMAGKGTRYDIVIADPPRMVKDRANIKRGLARYRRIYQNAVRLVSPGGILAVFTCSGLVSKDEFEDTVVASLREADRTGSVMSRLGAGADHPFRLRAGGGEYLQGLLISLLD